MPSLKKIDSKKLKTVNEDSPIQDVLMVENVSWTEDKSNVFVSIHAEKGSCYLTVDISLN